MSVHVTRLFNDGNAFVPHEEPLERLTVPCGNCQDGWILWSFQEGWMQCPDCLGTLTRTETDAEMAARLAGDLDEYNRLVAGPE